jgi:hypothetical protein
MAAATWKLVWIDNADMTKKGEIPASERTINFKLNQASTVEFKVGLNESMGRTIAAAPYGFGLVGVYRNSTLQFIAETTSLQVIGEGNEQSVAIAAVESAFPLLNGFLMGNPYVQGVTSDIVGDIRNALNSLSGVTGVDQGVNTASATAVGESILDGVQTLLTYIQSFAFRASGFDFWAVYNEPNPAFSYGSGGNIIATINTANIRGTTKPNAVFEYGANTRANLDKFTMTSTAGDNLVNVVYTNGPNTSMGNGGFAADNPSSLLFGTKKAIISTEFDNIALNEAYADLQIAKRAYPRLVFGFTPSPSDGTGRIPQFITDYDIGDIIPGKIVHEGVTLLNASVRIYGVTVTLDTSGMERIELTTTPDTSA